jgi:VWFA-related protein
MYISSESAGAYVAGPECNSADLPAPVQVEQQPPPSSSTPSLPLPGQPGAEAGAPGTFTIQSTARLVILDMVVVDAHDNPVKDLKLEEIHIQEASEPQTILNFDPAGAHTPAPDVSIESTADLDRVASRAPVNIILLDEFNTRFEDMAFARYSLKKYLDLQPGRLETPTMLVAVSLTKFDVLRDYTQNKDEILAALDHHFAAYPWQAEQGQWRGERYATAFYTLRRVAEAVLGHRGHKAMIWIGRGFPERRRPQNADLDEDNKINSAAQSCVNILRDARVTLYTIDPAGVMVNPGIYG